MILYKGKDKEVVVYDVRFRTQQHKGSFYKHADMKTSLEKILQSNC